MPHKKKENVLYTFSMSNVQENHTEESNHHSQLSCRSQVLIYFEYEPHQDFESQWIKIKKEENKEFSDEKRSYKKLMPIE